MTELTFFEYVYNTFKNFILHSSDYDSDFDLEIEDRMDVNDDEDNDDFEDFVNINPFNPDEPQLNPAPIPRNRILPNYDDFLSLFNNPAFPLPSPNNVKVLPTPEYPYVNNIIDFLSDNELDNPIYKDKLLFS